MSAEDRTDKTGEAVAPQAAALAERIVDEVAGGDQDWPAIAAWARELAALAESVPVSPGPPREQP